MKIGLRKRLAFEVFRRYKKNTVRLHELNYLFWECTLRCNLSCRHCGSDCRVSSSVKDMPLEDFLRVVDAITPKVDPAKTMIVLTGGEPLMRKDIARCGEELTSRGFHWALVTNGFLLDEKCLQSMIDAGMSSATVSLDGFEEAHNKLRGNKESYRRALHAIGLLASVEGLRFDVVTCVSRLNIAELKTLRGKLISIGVKEWRIFSIFPIGRAGQNDELLLENNDFRSLFDFMAETRKEGRIRLNYGCEGFLGEYEGEVRDNFFFCRAGVNIASVLADGSISACPNLRSNFIQGNIYTDDFMKVWNEKFQPHRDRSWTKTGICGDCELYRYCEGNSLHLRTEKNELLMCHMKKLEG